VSTISDCEELVKICSLSWGGKYFCIVPYTEADGISEDWWKLLSLYDPDMIFSSIPLDEVTEKRLLDMIATTWTRLDNRTPEHISVENPANHRDFVTMTGISLYSVLVALETYGNAENFATAVVPKFLENNPHRLYLTAKYGDLDETWAYSILSQLRINPDLLLQNFIPVNTFDVSENYADDIIFFHWHVHQSEENTTIPLIDYTEIGLKIQTSGRPMDKYDDPSIVFDVQQLIIVSEDISVEDFCWYWILRSQRYFHLHRLPLWISKATLLTYAEHIARLIHPREKSFLLSKTIPHQELEGIAGSFGEEMAVATNDLHKFYAEKFFIGIKDRQEVYFHENRTRIPAPQHDVVRYSGNRQHYYLDIEIPDYILPRLNISDWGLWVHKNYRVSRTGLSFDVQTWTAEPTQYLDLAIPTAWQMLEAFAELAGYTVELSDKGKVAEQVIQLVGGMEYYWLLAIPPVHRLFEQLSELYQAREFRSRLRDALKSLSVEETEAAEKQVMQSIATDRHEVRVQGAAVRETVQMGD